MQTTFQVLEDDNEPTESVIQKQAECKSKGKKNLLITLMDSPKTISSEYFDI